MHTLQNHPETEYEADRETAPLLSATSYMPSYVSMTAGCSEPAAASRRNASRLGKERPPSHSVATFIGATSSCISPSSMSANGEGKENRTALRPIGLVSKISLTLKNSGSVARDHLASERTFLAYVRTSLAIVTAGVGVYTLLDWVCL
ncbi:hypothetical protein APHAL10511_008299 [Amanita phalloides]|nr:hypothetical protein APHAL10511_008299 [Amanita phalloides]